MTLLPLALGAFTGIIVFYLLTGLTDCGRDRDLFK